MHVIVTGIVISSFVFSMFVVSSLMSDKATELHRQEPNVSNNEWKIRTENNNVNFFKKEVEEEWQSPWYFIQGADPQYGLIERYINKNPIPNWDKEIELTEKVVEKINSLNPKPRFFVICGDLCDAVPTENPDLYKAQEATFKRIFSKIDPSIPVLVTCGNHDVGDQPLPEGLEIYKASWGDDYYSFWCGGVLFLTINSQYLADSKYVGEFASKHEEWLYEQLKLAKSKSGSRVVLLQHIPWFLKSTDEEVEKSYFTLSKEVQRAMLDKLVDAGVEKAFCGHYHRNAGGTYKTMEVVVSSAIGGQLGPDKSGIRVVKVYKDKIEHEYYPIDDIPSSVKL
ncbi:hypothetical protein R5R35_011773 [Gryllus longicercus]|uniref:Serine/threonine-protein phosphatase CPPED1 n=2 Tax=Gryllus longicercus TaxID=2509291 RepID=A0AAN9W903_9ORTH